ncbi:MAG: type VI secretion system tube protein Hcp [Armatimonadetes bacterium]|nr:type VI secretion system tube protein Hcp [Armatimonadota bacterium]
MYTRRLLLCLFSLAAGLLACGCGGSTATNTGATDGLNDFVSGGQAVNAWLQFTPADAALTGESTDSAHQNWIDVTSVDWKLIREFKESAQAGTTDIFTGVAEVGPIDLTKGIDSSSTGLMVKAAGAGTIGSQARIAIRPTNASVDSMQILLDRPIVAGWSQTIESGNIVEKVSLWYYKVQLAYRKVSGSTVGTWQVSGWDRVANKPWVTPAPTTRGLTGLVGPLW